MCCTGFLDNEHYNEFSVHSPLSSVHFLEFGIWNLVLLKFVIPTEQFHSENEVATRNLFCGCELGAV